MITMEMRAALKFRPFGSRLSISDEMTDAELLTRFQSNRDESAFSELMRRHGPMVFHLCRRMLPALQDAEDVFQATFMSLSKQAATIRKKQSVVSWLYGVARHLALNLRLRSKRRLARERNCKPAANRSTELQEAWRELQDALDEELHRLPEKHQLPLVLCYLEGHTHEEAARHLGWPVGTVRGRVARAREQLRQRLGRRGLTLPATTLATVFAANTLSAQVPAAVMESAFRASLAVASTTAVAAESASRVASLLGSTTTMASSKAGMGMTSLLVVLVIAGAACIASVGGPAAVIDASTEIGFKEADYRADGKNEKPALDPYGDPLPAGAAVRIGTSRLWYGESGFGNMAFSNDGKRIAMVRDARLIRIVDLEKGAEIALIGENAKPFDPKVPRSVSFVAFSPDDSMIASVEFPRCIRLWDVKTGKQVKEFTADEPHGIFSCAISPDGKYLAAAGYDAAGTQNRVHLWDLKTDKELTPLIGHEKGIHSVAFSADGERIVTGSDDHTVRVWETAKSKEICALKGHEKQVLRVAITPDGKKAASVGLDSTFRLWDVADAKELHKWKDKYASGAIGQHGYFLAFVDDGKALCIGNGDGLEVRDVEKGEEIRRLPNGPGGFVVALSRDGKRFATASRVKRIRLYDAEDGKEKPIVADLNDGVTAFAYSTDGKLVAVGAGDGVIRISAAVDGKTVREIKDFVGTVHRLLFLPDGKHLMAVGTGGVENEVMTFEVETGKRTHHADLDKAPIVAASLSADGKRVFTRTLNKANAFDTADGKQLHETKLSGWLSDISPDGSRVVYPGYEAKLKQHVVLWDLDGNKEVARLHGETEDPPSTATFSADGTALITRTARGDFKVWNPTNGKFIRSIKVGNAEDRQSMYSHIRPAISPDGRMIAIPWEDKGIRIVETSTGGLRATVKSDQAGIAQIAWAADGSKFASCSQDCTTLLWDLTRILGDADAMGKLDEKQLEQEWSALAGDNSKLAFAAIRRLAGASDDAVKFLAKHLKTDPGVEANVLNKLIADLESEDLEARKQADAALAKLGVRAAGALTRALETKPTLDKAQRINALLAKVEDLQYSPEVVRDLRAIEALERIGTPTAAGLLKEIAKGASDSPITQDAQRSLKRLAKP